ncbi:Mitochondrial fission protein [Friedmanniomyces endolithicus]|nr:Mitochondrial fission protein [Friedmanniomyces endolithicus]KAK0848260.1 Mitochondrial fission protein [Friedmanniomyces endolithicus]
MADRGRSTSPRRSNHRPRPSQSSIIDDNLFDTRQIEAFGRTVHATASQLISANFQTSDGNGSEHYRSALTSVHRSLQRPVIQRSVFNLARTSPRELIRSRFQTSEIEHRALSYLPDELIRTAPASASPFSLFEGFKASLPDSEDDGRGGRRKKHGRRPSKLLEGSEEKAAPQLVRLKRDKDRLDHRLELMGIRKTMSASEIKEIDTKIANLNTMRKIVLERLAGLEQEEHDLEQEIGDLGERVDELQEQLEDEAVLAKQRPALAAEGQEARREAEEIFVGEDEEAEGDMAASFMSESIYGKLPKAKESPKPKRRRMPRRTISMPVLHEHMEPGTRIRELQAHNDAITAMDFDAPFGVMVTAALDDTVRVWDLNAGRCMGLLEGHLSSVRCLQVEEDIVATGSMDASIRLWDLKQADYNPQSPFPATNNISSKLADDPDDPEHEDEPLFTPAASVADLSAPEPPHGNAMADCHLTTLSAHVAEVTALHFRGNTLVSGSADKTLRQWDIERGRCVQTLDVLWAAAQASTVNPTVNSATTPAIATATGGDGGWWRSNTSRLRNMGGAGGGEEASTDFVGAVQVFDAALACGTADGMVRLWDLRSGMVHRSLVGHTGAVTSLQFDDAFLVTGSRDRSIRIWDLRTGTIHDAFAYDHPITSMQFDARRIVAAAGENIVKVYDKADGRQWDCGAGVAAVESETRASIVERVRIKDGYLLEGRRDGIVGVWSC